MDTVGSVMNELGRLASDQKAAHWDRAGLLLGDAAAAVETIAVCHEVNDAVVDAAIQQSIGLLVSYHPLLFRPITRMVAGSGATGRAFRLLRAGVAVGVVHTAWDAAKGGTADSLAAALDLDDIVGWSPMEAESRMKVVTFVPTGAADRVAAAMAAAGAGTIGNYTSCSFRSEGLGTFLPGEGSTPNIGEVGVTSQEPEMRLEMLSPTGGHDAVIEALVAAHPYEEPAFDLYEVKSHLGFGGRRGRWKGGTLGSLADRVRAALPSHALRVAGDLAAEVEHVAVLPGSGGFAVAAARLPTQVVVTGDVTHHQAADALDRGVAVIDAGHVATERPGVASLLARIQERWPRVADLTLDPDPWKGS